MLQTQRSQKPKAEFLEKDVEFVFVNASEYSPGMQGKIAIPKNQYESEVEWYTKNSPLWPKLK
jgi:hypothetical protein